jgi:uncharacterized protein YjeT (DUF2065 family)
MMQMLSYVIGVILVIKGVTLAYRPRFLWQVWDTKLRWQYPEFAGPIVNDFFNMSDRTIRYLGIWFAVLGGFMIWLASRVKN